LLESDAVLLLLLLLISDAVLLSRG